ncbi:hypothetical protein BSQ39_05550 [Loigolactobacillus backii]|nr:hypothetical protein BSQ39_05550 [Loigolactobacillus backii]
MEESVVYKEEKKLHYKLYKAGKHWLVAGITTAAIGLSFGVTHVAAATTTPQATNATEATASATSATATTNLTATSTAAADSTASSAAADTTTSSAASSATVAATTVSSAATSTVAASSATTTTSSNSSAAAASTASTAAPTNTATSSVATSTASSAATTTATTSSAASATVSSATSDAATSTEAGTSSSATSDDATASSAANTVSSSDASTATSAGSVASSAASSANSSAASDGATVTELGDADAATVAAAKASAEAAYAKTGTPQVLTRSAAEAKAAVKNGWVTENGAQVYYKNGVKATGYDYDGSHWYLFSNGVRQSDVQKWANTYYYFDHTTYLRVDNNYLQSRWGDWYLFGKNGQIKTGVQKWAGTYYDFDAHTYLRVNNNYVRSQWGDWYLFGKNGQIQTKVQKWAGSYYYFNPSTYLREDNAYLESQWGDWYLFGSNGRIVSGNYTYGGSKYYFNPTTYLLTSVTPQSTSGGVDAFTIGDPMRPKVSAIDISSYQYNLTQANYNTMKSLGVKTVIVKVTEGTDYTNPYAASQIKMAQNAGLKVAVYDYAKFSSSNSAVAEATYMANKLNSLGLSKSTLVIADMEDTSTANSGVGTNLSAFWNTLSNYGYKSHSVYTFVSYAYRDAVVNTVGAKKTWMAQYPYSPMSNSDWNSNYAAWQFSDTGYLPGYSSQLDVSIDYSGLF